MAEPLLRSNLLTRRFGGLTAVDGATVLSDQYELLAFGAKIGRREFIVIDTGGFEPTADSGIVLVSERGSASSDRLHDQAVQAGAVDPQRFPYTLATTAIGEASIRLGIRGPGMSLHGADGATALAVVHDLLADGVPGVLLAAIEADQPPHRAHAEWWTM